MATITISALAVYVRGTVGVQDVRERMEIHRDGEGSRNSGLQGIEQHAGRGNEGRDVSTTRNATSSAEPTSARGANRKRPRL